MSKKKKIYWVLTVGFLVTAIGTIASYELLSLLGHIIVIYSCYMYSELKGYSRILGLVLGLFFNMLGFIVLLLLKDKNKNKKFSTKSF